MGELVRRGERRAGSRLWRDSWLVRRRACMRDRGALAFDMSKHVTKTNKQETI
jgi:hypothetical protein